jgi:hypothetical protein
MTASPPAQPGSASPALVPYADLPARWGVSVVRGPGFVTVSVPPVPSWRYLGGGFHASIAILSAIIVCWFYVGVVLRRAPPAAFIPQMVAFSIPLAIVIAVAVVRLRRRVVVSVTGALVALGVLDRRGTGRWASWPREKVLEIRVNPFNGNLLIRIESSDLVERYLSPNAEVNRAVAETLAAALRDVPIGASAGAEDELAARRVNPVATRTKRRLLLACGGVMFVAGIIMFQMPFPIHAAGVYVLIGSIVPFGIVFGTQEREYYL